MLKLCGLLGHRMNDAPVLDADTDDFVCYVTWCGRGDIYVVRGELEEVSEELHDPTWGAPGSVEYHDGWRVYWRTWGWPERFLRGLVCHFLGHAGFNQRLIALRSWQQECAFCRAVLGPIMTDKEFRRHGLTHERMEAGVG
jgi:hypothetical protein